MTLHDEQHGHTKVLTIDRPEAKNAIDRELAIALHQAMLAAANDPRTHAVVLRSADARVFVSGGDLNELARLPMSAAGAQTVLALGAELGQIERCAVPVIAAVEGAAFGGGCELLMMCDLIVMGRGASLHFVHAHMGLVPAWGGTTRLSERVGSGAAADILLGTCPLSAERAVSLGIAQRLVEPGQATAVALGFAERLGELPRDAVTAIKRSLGASKGARRGDALTAEAKVFRAVWGSEAHRAAFGSRRAGRSRSEP